MGGQLIIAGFHRSGTSAVAQLLHRAGLFLGEDLLQPLPSNKYGHFEDREMVGVHNGILQDNRRDWMIDAPFLPVVGADRWRRMSRIIDQRNASHALWGFKDPRVCMFLGLWKYLLPDAKVLIVYRHFSDSAYSLGRRHSENLFVNFGHLHKHRRFFQEPDLALRMWLAHNEALLAFARAYPEDTLAVSLNMVEDGFPLVRVLNERWGFGLEEVPVGEVLDPAALRVRAGRQPVSDGRLVARIIETWEALEELGAGAERLVSVNGEEASGVRETATVGG